MQFHARSLCNLHKFIQGSEQMRASQEGIGHRNSRTSSRVDGHRPVVFLTEPCYILEFVYSSIYSRLIHQSQRKAACTLLQGILHNVEHPPALVFSELSVLISSHACPCRAMTGKNGDVTWGVAIYGCKEFRNRRIYTCCILEREQSSSNLIDMCRI